MLYPPHLAQRFTDHYLLQILHRSRETFFDGHEAIFVFDADDIIVTVPAECADDISPCFQIMAVADRAELPGSTLAFPYMVHVGNAIHLALT